MSSPLHELPRATLAQLAGELERGQIPWPPSSFSLANHVPAKLLDSVAAEMAALASHGMRAFHVAWWLRAIVQERDQTQMIQDEIELVWTGFEGTATGSRDTKVVVRELFASAATSVMIAGYAIAQGKAIFEPLAKRMEELPSLQVRMYLNVIRPQNDFRPAVELIQEFTETFKREHWPWRLKPEIYIATGALNQDGPRSALHAKVVVVDAAHALITSANFTEAAHLRNVEAGVLVHRPTFAQSVLSQFEGLIRAGVLVPLPGL